MASTCIAPASASSSPQRGSWPRTRRQARGKPRPLTHQGHTASIANVTPSANVSLPIHRSPAAAKAKQTAPQRARGPYTSSAIRSKANVDTSTAKAPTSSIPKTRPAKGTQGCSRQVMAGVPVVVPDLKPELSNRLGAVGLRRQIRRARRDHQPRPDSTHRGRQRQREITVPATGARPVSSEGGALGECLDSPQRPSMARRPGPTRRTPTRTASQYVL